MTRTIKAIDAEGQETELTLRATASVPRLYRFKFGRDMLQDMRTLLKAQKATQSADKFRAARAEAKRTKEKLPDDHEFDDEELFTEDELLSMRETQFKSADLLLFENVAYIMARHADPTIPDTVEEWLDGYAMFHIHEILPVIGELWQANTATTSKPKKNTGK